VPWRAPAVQMKRKKNDCDDCDGALAIQVDDVDGELFDALPLSSKVLRDYEEGFSYSAARDMGTGTFEYEVDVATPASFVSVPLATRIACDAGIVSLVRFLGYDEKSFSIWGDRALLEMPGRIDPRRPVRLVVTIPKVEAVRGARQSVLVNFRFGQNAAFGSLWGSFRVPRKITGASDAQTKDVPQETDSANSSAEGQTSILTVIRLIFGPTVAALGAAAAVRDALGMEIDFTGCCSFACVVLIPYILDRWSSDQFSKNFIIGALVLGMGIFSLVADWAAVGSLITFFAGLSLYSRVKRIRYFKNVWVASVWAQSVLVAAGTHVLDPRIVSTTIFLWTCSFISCSVCDIKDIEDDRRHGIYTFANLFGARWTRKAGVLLNLVLSVFVFVSSMTSSNWRGLTAVRAGVCVAPLLHALGLWARVNENTLDFVYVAPLVFHAVRRLLAGN